MLRAIFRACLKEAQRIAEQQNSIRTSGVFDHVSWGTSNWGQCRAVRAWSRPKEEYAADFLLVTRRTLTAEQLRLFEMHFLRGLDWLRCSAKLGLDRGNFFHAVYRIQQKLGRVYAELQPYALYPPHTYFSTIRRAPLAEGSTTSGPHNAAPSPIPFPPLKRIKREPAEPEPFVDDPMPESPVVHEPEPDATRLTMAAA